MADLLSLGVSGLKVAQSALQTTGHNISNAHDEAYTLQRVEQTANPPQFSGAGFVGSGASVIAIERMANDFLTSQIRSDTTAFSELDAFTEQISQIDNLLANESTGLAAGLQQFFSAVQSAADDPTSIPARQSVLSQVDVLSQRFNSLYERFEDLNTSINQELDSISGQITSLAGTIANINESIASVSASGGGNPPNDLLDKRDEAMRQLAELVSISPVEESNGSISLFIGNGQPLVIGNQVMTIDSVNGQTDPSRKDLSYTVNGNSQVITNNISGGRLGGLLDFRDKILDRSYNELGRTSLAVSEELNRIQTIGLDLNGNYGVPILKDVNDRQATLERVVPSSTNGLPNDRIVSATIDDASLLENSDYMLTMSSVDSYTITRLSDDTVVQSGGLPAAKPTSISYGGFTVTFESGSFQDGDRYRVQPTRFGARDIEGIVTKPELLAFASPILTDTPLGNTGSGAVDLGNMLAVKDSNTGLPLPMFSNSGELNPPLVVRFSSATTYEILDNTDPANPKSLNPPLENLSFIPGISNQIMPDDIGQTVVYSEGYNAGRIPSLNTTPAEIITGPIGTTAANNYIAETVTITYTDPITGLKANQPPLQIGAGSSASLIAAQLSNVDGVSATASTYAEISINDDAAGSTFELYLNGEHLTLSQPNLLGPLPNPMTNDYIAEAINLNGALAAQGIRATSDGLSIKVVSDSGEDLKFSLEGDTTDFIEVKGKKPATLLGDVNLSSGADLDAGGPNSFTLDLMDGPGGLSNPMAIPLSGAYTTGQDLVAYVQKEIDTAYGVPGKVNVSLDSRGNLQFETAKTDLQASIEVTAVGAADPLGLATAATAGVIRPGDVTAMTGAGIAGNVNALTVGGTLLVTLDENYSLDSNTTGAGNIFAQDPVAVSNFFGFTINISGNPDAGDEFTIGFNENGVSDNRNALKFIDLESKKTVAGNSSFHESYGKLVQYVGTITAQKMVNSEAAGNILAQSKELRNAISGVNLDEEAAKLIKFELAYNASSQVISVARDMFDTLLSTFR